MTKRYTKWLLAIKSSSDCVYCGCRCGLTMVNGKQVDPPQVGAEGGNLKSGPRESGDRTVGGKDNVDPHQNAPDGVVTNVDPPKDSP